jgi:hypoxanthine phosphoribosyltransferase
MFWTVVAVACGGFLLYRLLCRITKVRPLI